MISCLMPTYNKFPRSQTLVEEAVESFLRQTYKDAELVILNDAPEQLLTCDAERVRIINHHQRYPNLGDKLNALTELAQGDILCRWDDDDINLPWGLTWRHRVLEEQQADYVCPKRFWATNGDKTSFGFGSYAQCMYRRTVHEKLNGYGAKSFGEDQDFEILAGRNGFKVLCPAIDIDDTFYFYRWGTGSEHLSGYGRQGQGWDKIGNRTVVPGTYHIEPKWTEDYVARAETAKVRRRAQNKA